MPEAARPSMAKLMAPLRARYLQDLALRCDELKALLDSLRNADMSAILMDHLALLAHNMAGSGATYGFVEISRKARALEDSLSSTTGDRETIIAELGNLIAYCETLVNRPVKVSLQELARPAMEQVPKANVLVVDDNQEIRRLFSTLLADCANVTGARTAEEALAVLATSLPDLILLDDQMPGGLSGTAMLETLRTNPTYRFVPVIMVTAMRDAGMVQRTLNSGVIDFITKPFQPQHTALRIKAHLNRLRTSVLIVDDDTGLRAMLYNVFNRAGFQTRMAENGKVALTLMKQAVPDLVLLDYMMPGMNGVDVLMAMNEDKSLAKVRVVFLTAKTDMTDVTRVLKLGAVDYLVKPFSPKRVLNRCLQIVEARGATA